MALRERAEAEAHYLDLVAPAAGKIIRRDGEIGQMIAPDKPLFWMSCCAPLRVSAEVDEEDIAQVRPGQEVLIRADAFPGQIFHGTVQSITPKGDPVARTYRVRISLPADTPLMIGMTAETNIVLRKADNALLVPAGAVQQDTVWRVDRGKLENGRSRWAPRTRREVEILSGLGDGDRIVAHPTPGLEGRADGAPVRGRGAVMLGLAPTIALKHLLARPRQSIVSLSGIVLGVAFFLAVSSLMQGSETDFIRRLVDNSPHITVSDEFRNPRLQPAEQLYPNGAVEIRSVKPLTETRGIRHIPADHGRRCARCRICAPRRCWPDRRSSRFAGKDVAISLNGMIPSEVSDVTTIRNYMIAGSLDELIANPDGIVVGDGLVRKLSLSLGRERDADLPDRRGSHVQDPRAFPYRARHLRRHAGLRRSEAGAGAAEAAEPGQYDHRQAR